MMKRLLSLTLTLAMLVTLGLGTAMSVSAKNLVVVQEEIFDEGDAESSGSGVSQSTTHSVSSGMSEAVSAGTYPGNIGGWNAPASPYWNSSTNVGTPGIGAITFGGSSSTTGATSVPTDEDEGNTSPTQGCGSSVSVSGIPGIIPFGIGSSKNNETSGTSKGDTSEDKGNFSYVGGIGGWNTPARPEYGHSAHFPGVIIVGPNNPGTGTTSGTSSDGEGDEKGGVSYSEATGTLGIDTIEFGVANSSKKSATSGTSKSYNNGSLTRSQVKTLQKALGVAVDGYYGNASRAAAGGLDADAAYKKFVKNTATAVNRRAGDMNGDGKVNLSDCSQLLKLMQKPSSCTANDIKYGDLNHDGVLNYADYSCMLSLAKGK